MEKKKNKIKSAFALALSLGLLCQSFPAFAEEKPWDVNDNIISFREIPDLVDQFSTVAKMEQDALAQSTGDMASVQKAVKDEKADILANLQESIDSLKEQKQDTTDPTTKAFAKPDQSVRKGKEQQEDFTGYRQQSGRGKPRPGAAF